MPRLLQALHAIFVALLTLLDHITFSNTTLILGFTALLLFRKSISGLIDRIRKIGASKEGVQFDASDSESSIKFVIRKEDFGKPAPSFPQASPAEVKDVVEARAFVVKDKEGRTRALLGSDADAKAVALHLYDENERNCASFTVGGDGAGIVLRDDKGQPRVFLRTVASIGSALGIMDEQGKIRFVTGTTPAGEVLQLFQDKRKNASPTQS